MKQFQMLKHVIVGAGLTPAEADKVIGKYQTPMSVVIAGAESIFDASESNVANIGRLVIEVVLAAFHNLAAYSPDAEYVGPTAPSTTAQPDLAGVLSAIGGLASVQQRAIEAQFAANRPTVYELRMNQTLEGLSKADGDGYDRKELVGQAQRLLVGFTGQVDDRVVACQEQNGLKLVIVNITQRAISDLHVARNRNASAELPVEYAGHRLVTFEALLPKEPGVIVRYSPCDASQQLFGDNLAEGRLEWRVSSDSNVQDRSLAFAIWAIHLDTHGLWQGMKGATATRLLPFVFAKTSAPPDHLTEQVEDARKATVDFEEAMGDSTIRRRIEQHLFEGISAAQTGGAPSPFVGSGDIRKGPPKPPPVRVRSLVHPQIRQQFMTLFGSDMPNLRNTIINDGMEYILSQITSSASPESYINSVLAAAEQAGALHQLYEAVRQRYSGNRELGSILDWYDPGYRWTHYLNPKMTLTTTDAGRRRQLRMELLQDFSYQTLIQATSDAGFHMERLKTDEPGEAGLQKILEEVIRQAGLGRFLSVLILRVD